MSGKVNIRANTFEEVKVNLKEKNLFPMTDFKDTNNSYEFEKYLRHHCFNFETIGDYIYFNYYNKQLIDKILTMANSELNNFIRNKTTKPSYIIYLALIIIQMRYYKSSFWVPVHEFFSVYKDRDSTQNIDCKIRKIIGSTFTNDIDTITRQSTMVQYDSIFSCPHVHTIYEICYDYYSDDLDYGKTETSFIEESDYLLNGLKHRFSDDTFEEDSVKISSKVYSMIKSTRIRIKHSNDALLDLISEVLKMIDSYFWESEIYTGNHFLYNHFLSWATYIDQKNRHKTTESRKVKTNKEHIIRKPDLFYSKGSIFFKVPNQKLDNYYKTDTVKLEVTHDNVNTTHIPSITEKLIGYSLEGCIEKVYNPFDLIKYKIYTKYEIMYENTLNILNYLIFSSSTGRRLEDLHNYVGEVVFLSLNTSDLSVSNGNVTSKFTNSVFTIRYIDINENTIINVDGNLIGLFSGRSKGIFIDSESFCKAYINNVKIDMTSKIPNIFIEHWMIEANIIIKINDKNFSVNKDIEIDGNMCLDLKQQFEEDGVYNLSVINPTNRKQLFNKSLYYIKNYKISSNKNLYFRDETPKIDVYYDGQTVELEYRGNNKVYSMDILDFEIFINLPFVDYHFKCFEFKEVYMFKDDLPLNPLMYTKNIDLIYINDQEILKEKDAKGDYFDFTSAHNISSSSNSLRVQAETRRGKKFLFNIYLEEFIDKSKSYISYNRLQNSFQGEMVYIGKNVPIVNIKSDKDNLDVELTKPNFTIEYPQNDMVKFEIYTLKDDKFGLNTNKKRVLYQKLFKLVDPKKMIGKFLKSSAKVEGKRKHLLSISAFNIRITNYLGENDFVGEAFVISCGKVIEFIKFSPIRIEFMTNNYNTEFDDFKIYLNDTDEIFSNFSWTLEEGETGYGKRKIQPRRKFKKY